MLHVDDDPAYGKLFTHRVEAEADLSVTSVTSPAAALERLAAEEFDCLVSDYRMPDADGLDLLHRVRERRPDLPVVLLTGKGSEALASKAISAGVTDYFRKDGGTGQFDLLANRLETVAEKHRTERVLEAERRRNDEFVRLVAHDLRNPMAVVRGWLDMLNEDVDETYVEKAQAALGRMDDILDNLETLARSGDAETDSVRIELSAVATAAWELVDPDEAELRVEYGPSLEGDPSMLQQVFENLFANAVEHGGRDVTVRVGVTEDGEGFYVADDGPGIPEEERERVFESGYSPGGDTGLGLAIVRRIADAHGWTVTARESDHDNVSTAQVSHGSSEREPVGSEERRSGCVPRDDVSRDAATQNSVGTRIEFRDVDVHASETTTP